jgi:hypothetical protein
MRAKNRNKWEDISDTMKTIMALHNIDRFPEIVQTKIMKISDDEWDDFLNSKDIYFKEEIIMIQNLVIILSLIFILQRQAEREVKQRGAYEELNSVSTFLIQVKYFLCD